MTVANVQRMRAGTVLRKGAIQLMLGGRKGSKAESSSPADMRNIPPFPRQASALAQEFGLSFATDNDYNGRGKGKVTGSYFACPDALEEKERVFGPDPFRSFVPGSELEAKTETAVGEDVPFWKLFGISDVVRDPNGPELIILTLANQPELIGSAYVMAEKEGAKEVLALLPKATEKAVKCRGAEAIISALDAEDCDGTGWGSLKKLQQFARKELYRQKTGQQERGCACGVLQVLGFSLEDINKGRTRPTLATA